MQRRSVRDSVGSGARAHGVHPRDDRRPRWEQKPFLHASHLSDRMLKHVLRAEID